MREFNLKLTKITSEIKNNKDNFYLGAWCLADLVDDNFSNLLIHEYHWNNRKKLIEDYHGLNDYISYNFGEFSEYMANITGAPNDKRYWKINLGTWIGYLIQILFDRWENIRTLPSFEFNLLEMPFDISTLRSNTVRDYFSEIFSDYWNERVYRLILNAQKKKIKYNQSKVNNFKTLFDGNEEQLIKNSKLSLKLKISNKIIKLAHKIQQPEYFIINSYLSRINEIKLKILLKEFPFNYKRSIYHPWIDYNNKIVENKKSKILSKINFKIDKESSWNKRNQDFLFWFKEILPYFIPCNYFLNFKKFYKNMQELPFPKKPKVIFTSVLHVQHDYFNLYTSERVYEGSKYIIGQHGGAFRSMKICYLENLHKELPDYYLTWGNDKLNDNLFPAKIFPVGNLKTSSKKILKKKIIKKRVLLLTIEYPRYSYVLTSAVVSSQWLEYYKDLKNFLQKSSDLGFDNQIAIRNKLRKYGWNLFGKLSSHFPNLQHDKINDYFKSVKSSSLVISTYNGATYLETMSINIPTIIFWDPKYWELNDISKNDYDDLQQVGIFHTSPISAAEFYNKIEKNVDDWWYSEKVQRVRKKFCIKYSKNNNNISYEIRNIMKEAI